MNLMTPSQQNKNEWARMAQAAYAAGRNAVGHRFSALASMRSTDSLSSRDYDLVQGQYRAWLIDHIYPSV